MNGVQYINLSEVEGVPHQELFDKVAQVIAEDTLNYINEYDKIVNPRNTIYVKYIKRMFDILLSAVALLVTLPINLLLAVCTYIDVGHPIIFRQQRIGKDGKSFTIIKFRNMTDAKNSAGELLPPSQRVTKFGEIVRKLSLDELLNFWSIFKGDMSFIGPRPLAVEYMNRYSDRHIMRHAVRPGLECPNISKKGCQNTWAEQFENEIYYVENVSILLDVKMILALAGMVFNKRSSNIRGKAVRGSFIGYNKDGSSINSRRVPACYVVQVMQGEQGSKEISEVS